MSGGRYGCFLLRTALPTGTGLCACFCAGGRHGNDPAAVGMVGAGSRFFRHRYGNGNAGYGLVIGGIRVVGSRVGKGSGLAKHGIRFVPCKTGGQFYGCQRIPGGSLQPGGDGVNGRSFLDGKR